MFKSQVLDQCSMMCYENKVYIIPGIWNLEFGTIQEHKVDIEHEIIDLN